MILSQYMQFHPQFHRQLDGLDRDLGITEYAKNEAHHFSTLIGLSPFLSHLSMSTVNERTWIPVPHTTGRP
jgi:hypothetical protein